MIKTVLMVSALALASVSSFHAVQAADKPAMSSKKDLVEFETMTWEEVKAALEAGKTTALFYTGGTEQRGPQNTNGGHTLMARAINKAIAEKLGNAIAMPVLPFTPNRASADLPGTLGLTPELLGAVLERLTDEAVTTGFKNVILMGDHGGGQPKTYDEVAKKMNEKYSPQGVHVYYCDQVYKAANDEFDKYLQSKNIPLSLHAGVPDTSMMLYLGGDTWVRKDKIPNAVGTPVVDGKAAPTADSPKNGITGDARKSTAELGKKQLEMKVDFAVKQIKEQIASGK